ncbi:MAG: DUF2147 domain-containing protein [Roseiarcus sp.]
MRTRLRFAVAIASAVLAAGYVRSASSQDNIPLPPPNPFKTAAPAAAQDDVPLPPPNPFKNAAPAVIPSETAAPPASPSKAAAPPPNQEKTATPAPIPTEIAAPAPYQYKTAAGFWQETDEQGHVGAWFLFVEKNGLYEGRFVKLFKQPGEQREFQTCERCTGDQKDAPMLGLTLVKGMKRNGNRYDGGTILDPRDGTVYHAQMELSADGLELSVRGYLGIPLLGQTQVWSRLPDDVMAPADIPEESFAPAPAPTQD